jgi:hypothetical protein
MRVNGIKVFVVMDAYDIAANYLKSTGRMPHDVDFEQSLFDSIASDFLTGRNNKLVLANRAIARIEKAGDVLELIP